MMRGARLCDDDDHDAGDDEDNGRRVSRDRAHDCLLPLCPWRRLVYVLCPGRMKREERSGSHRQGGRGYCAITGPRKTHGALAMLQ